MEEEKEKFEKVIGSCRVVYQVDTSDPMITEFDILVYDVNDAEYKEILANEKFILRQGDSHKLFEDFLGTLRCHGKT